MLQVISPNPWYPRCQIDSVTALQGPPKLSFTIPHHSVSAWMDRILVIGLNIGYPWSPMVGNFRHEKTAILGYLQFFVKPISIANRLNPHSWWLNPWYFGQIPYSSSSFCHILPNETCTFAHHLFIIFPIILSVVHHFPIGLPYFPIVRCPGQTQFNLPMGTWNTSPSYVQVVRGAGMLLQGKQKLGEICV